MNEEILKVIGRTNVNLNYKRIGNEELQFLCTQKVSHVTILYLGNNQITRDGMLHFPRANWESLITLQLNGNNIGNMGCKYLSRASLNRIQELWIDQNPIGSEGVLHLSKAQWSTLESLALSSIKFGVEGIRWLMRTKWSSIKNINLKETKLSEHQLIHYVLCEFQNTDCLCNVEYNSLREDRRKHLNKIFQDSNVHVFI